MKKMNKKVYAAAGYNTISFGPGRKEFNPKKPMKTFEPYLTETAEGTCAQLQNSDFDEGVIANFMAPRFIKQGNLAGFLPFMVESLRYKPCIRVEGACGSGGLGITTAIKSVLSGMAESVFVVGFEIQNTMKAVYGADVLGGAGYFNQERKNGHAFFFPASFSDKAGAYFEKYGKETTRKAMSRWFELAVKNARLNPKAQEYHNKVDDLFALGMTPANPKVFLEHLNVFDCSKVSDGASSLVILSEEGLEKFGVAQADCVEITGYGQAEGDITLPPQDLTVLDTTVHATKQALAMAGATVGDIGITELHDCFTITGLLALESIGFVKKGEAPEFVLDGNTAIDGSLPSNATGGLVGFGHYTGGTGVRQMVDLIHQFTGKAAKNQVNIKKPNGMMVSMGGNDKSVVSVIVQPA